VQQAKVAHRLTHIKRWNQNDTFDQWTVAYIVVLMGDGLLRLTEPLVRESGRLRAASWEEALERAAGGFAAARDKGPNAFGMFSCSKTTNEMNFMAQKFARAVMHSNNIDSCNRT
jgi:formate dehydrogenase (hydrogenase)